MTKFFIFILFSLQFSYASTGDGRTVGNGGDVLKCPISKSEDTYQILDWYEGSAIRALNLDLGPADLSIEEKLQIALLRLERVSPDRAKRYAGHLKTFFAETKWLTTDVLIDIKDSDHILLPHPDCRILQIANQSTPILSIEKRYMIDKNLWDHLDNDNKAALLLHEVIYREAIEIGHKNSVSTRYLNSLILSREMETLSLKEFSEILSKLDFKSNTVQGLLINLDESEFYDNGLLKSARVLEGAKLLLEENLIPVKDNVLFYEDGSLAEFTPLTNATFKYHNNTFNAFPFPVSFHSNGNLKSLLLNKGSSFKFNEHELVINGSVKFFENGFLKNGIVEAGKVKAVSISASFLNVHDAIEFHENGSFSKGKISSTFEIPNFKGQKSWQGLVQLNQAGIVLGASLALPLAITLQGKKFNLAPFQYISFWENGKIKSLELPIKATLLSQKNNLVKIEANTLIRLNQEERILE